jgi:hypothetical protein
MAVANTLAFYDTVAITAVKSFIVQTQKRPLFCSLIASTLISMTMAFSLKSTQPSNYVKPSLTER